MGGGEGREGESKYGVRPLPKEARRKVSAYDSDVGYTSGSKGGHMGS